MMIDKLGKLDPTLLNRAVGKTDTVRGSAIRDTVDISPEAKTRAEISRVKELAMNAPEMSEERVASLRALINDPAKLNARIEGTADKIMAAMGF